MAIISLLKTCSDGNLNKTRVDVKVALVPAKTCTVEIKLGNLFGEAAAAGLHLQQLRFRLIEEGRNASGTLPQGSHHLTVLSLNTSCLTMR
jgi:hypothetical protein